MGLQDRVKELKEVATTRAAAVDAGRLAGDAVVAASDVLNGAEAVARRSGLTKRDGSLSMLRLAKAAAQPGKTVRTVLDATADEVRERRGPSEG